MTSNSKDKLVDTSSTQTGTWRREIEKSLHSASQLISKSASPLPENPYAPKNDPSNEMSFSGLVSDLRRLGFRDVETLLNLFSSEVRGAQDDSKLLLENLIQLLSKLDDNQKISRQLTGNFVNTLWDALPHPSLTSMDSKYKYRQADGSYNNIRIPDIGKAGMAYARSAKPTIFQNIALPDPGLIFDSLMARGDKFEPHPNKISSMLFYLATIIIHDVFRTDHKDFNISLSSSYLDLAPLYGNNQEEQDLVRTFKDGMLKPDCFSEKRILGMPAGVGVFVIMFNRFHNYVVTQLARINESGRFTKPKEDAEESAWVTYDNDLFQTGRLITCGLYINIVLKDYVRTILSLNRVGTKWDLDPRTSEGKNLFNTPAAEGVGNQVSAEFNLIYRWHSAISEKDDKWTQDVYANMFPGRNPEDVSLPELLGALRTMEKSIPQEPLQRNFAGLKRDSSTNKFKDDDLVTILESSISDVAGSFGANRVPKILKSVEILGIMQAREWNMATLNEFRQFAGLTKHTSFEDINPDKEVAERLRNLYDHPDYVELYPGLVAEKAKPPMSPGSGLCVNFTTSYAILSDAVGLVRGDRFYTIDYTPKNLTNWGFNEVNFDTNVDDGAVLYKLILRAFPNHFKGNSVYAHFPFVIPSENLTILKSLGRAEKYSWDKPTRKKELVIIKTHAACKTILEDKKNFKVTWGDAITFLVSTPKKTYASDFCLAGDEPVNLQSRKLIMKGMYPQNWHQNVKDFYEETTRKLLAAYSWKIPGKKSRQIDIVRDVANLVNARFAASVFSLPIKTTEHPRGIYTEQELYQVLSIIFISIFFDVDVAKSFQVKEAARMLAQQLGELVLINAEAIEKTGFIADLLAKLHESHNVLTEYGTHMIQRLLDCGLEVKEVVWSHLMPTAAAMTANQSQIFSQALEYYLGDGAEHLPELYRLSHLNTKAADDTIMRYFLEGARLSGAVALFRTYNPPSNSPITLENQTIIPGSRIFTDLITASRDPLVFPNPTQINLTRPLENYLQYGLGPHQCAGMDASLTAMTAMFRIVFGLKGLRRAAGSQGVLKTVDMEHGKAYLTSDWSSFWPFPTTLKVVWDEE